MTEKRDFLIEKINKLNKLVFSANSLINNSESRTHIIPLLIGSNEKTIEIAEKLKAEGYYIPAIRPPTVPMGSSRLRLSLTADSNIADVENLFAIYKSLL